MSVDTAQRWEQAFAKKQQKLVQTSTNLVDEIWSNRPPAGLNLVVIHPLEYAGRSVPDKLKYLREKLTEVQARGIIFTALDEVCIWFVNFFCYELSSRNYLVSLSIYFRSNSRDV